MVAFRRALLSGCAIWLIGFVSAFALFPVREAARPLFESIMPVVLAVATVFFAHRCFKATRGSFTRHGFLLGVLWMGISVLVDLPLMLSPSPMQMTLAEYVGDIGVTYLLIPVITTGMGLARAQADAPPPSGGPS